MDYFSISTKLISLNEMALQEIYHIWKKYPYLFGDTFCVIRGLAAETSANATVLTITAFTVERYVICFFPYCV